ncbi:hypothetical protein [Paludisphaera rhizosphaerae]|uniref:hypothetical protein n=1 Tax=Paludisphaera rhizosphaerae TaxID=2711216 RepID=UPI0013E9C0B5|nr:hypothetical protein [Paludisphaera rhizosphaerae]
MTSNHILSAFRVWLEGRKSRLPGLIATLCLTAAGLLALASAARRQTPRPAVLQTPPPPCDHAESERRREAMDRRQADLIDRFERMLDGLSANR